LAAARRGAYGRASVIAVMLSELAGRGLLVDGTAPPHPVLDAPDEVRPEPADRPLEPLEGFSLRCDGNGSCCTTYASIPFSPRERHRALAAVPEIAEELEPRDRLFLPLHGAEPAALRAVSMIDGACAFLDGEGRCRIHARVGGSAKPRGCQMFPAQLVDDGEAVRVSVAVECACVLASLEGEERGDNLVPEGARQLGDLSAGTRVVTLPESVVVSEGRKASRHALRAFTSAAMSALGSSVDGVAVAWSLAEAVAADGLDEGAARQAVASPSAPQPQALRSRLVAIAATTSSKRQSVPWRSERDRARRLAGWLDHAAQLLLEPEIQREHLAGPGPWAQHEAFYLRAVLHGYQLGLGRQTVAEGFRDRAVRMVLARSCGAHPPGEPDPSAAYPITAVEAAMRGQGLEGYAGG
jgi:lysine-N-methylase